jgi:hypothetical protein
MTFWTAVSRSYTQAWRFLFALPLIALAIIGFEGLQHIVEWNGGMYRDMAGMKAAGGDITRLTFGMVKVIWLIVAEYWVIRFTVSGSAQAALDLDPVAVRKFGLILLINFALAVCMLIVPVFVPAGPAHKVILIAISLVSLLTFPLDIAMDPWIVGAAIGDKRSGPWFALKRAWGSIWWGLALTFAVTLPPMIGHYVLGFAAVAKPALVAIPMLAFDAVLVGFLGVVMHTCTVMVAARMAASKGETLQLGLAET